MARGEWHCKFAVFHLFYLISTVYCFRPSQDTNPTVYPAANIDVASDSRVLHEALKNSNEAGIVNVLTQRSWDQRIDIHKNYLNIYNKNLSDEFNEKLSGEFRDLMVAMITPWTDYFYQELYDAVENSELSNIVDILCGQTGDRVLSMAKWYRHSFNESLTDALNTPAKRYIYDVCVANRNDNAPLDPMSIADDAKNLFSSDTSFEELLKRRTHQQLYEILMMYAHEDGNDIEKMIEDRYSGDMQTILLDVVQCIMSEAKYFAKRLLYSVKGPGTDERLLSRIILTRSEIDLEDIKAEFFNIYPDLSLADYIDDDTSGSYNKALIALVTRID